ncbi:MAG: trypsin-like peptidase domain-containing protein [Defluviitaleaceae bacterium]|nr:trypsin-like peptidase domain-containing protein [Defluviitaleaceae bacterium]
MKKIFFIFSAICLGGVMLGLGIAAGNAVFVQLETGVETIAQNTQSLDATITTVHVNPLIVPLDTEEPCFVEIIARARPSVVSIDVVAPSGRSSRVEVPGSGSGFVFAGDNEYVFIATNNHVIENATSITISLDDEEHVSARLVGYDRASDVAVIAASRTDLRAAGEYAIATLGDSDALRMGDSVIAIGNAMGEGQTVTRGIISAVSLNIEIPDVHQRLNLNVLQTDAAVNRGNSGGPLVNQNGEVVGIVTAKLIGSDIEGMGYALPINDVRHILDDIIEVGAVRRAFIGIRHDEISEFMRDLFNFPSTGILVQEIIENSPAEDAGIEPLDLITHIDGQRIENFADFQSVLNTVRPGDEITLGIYREGERMEIRLVLGSRMS